MARKTLLPRLVFGLMSVFLAGTADARPFSLSGVNLELQDVTSNVDVYFTAMRYNRVSNEWDVNVTLSNKVGAAQSGPMVLVVDSFTGTAGPLRIDGVSSNQPYFDMSGQLAQGGLAVAQQSSPRIISFAYTAGASPKVVTSVYATVVTNGFAGLGFTRTLNDVSQPLPNVAIQQTGPDGTATNTTDPVFGVVTLSGSPGKYTWEFSTNGYLPVWRQATLQSNVVTTIPYPHLTLRTLQTNTLTPLAAGIISNQTVQVQFASGAIGQNTTAQLTVLNGQSLPIPLPQGWSPMQAFWLELSSQPTQPATATLLPWGNINNFETAILAQFDPVGIDWKVIQMVPGNSTNEVTVNLPGSGAYCLVVPDPAPGNPPAATLGAVLSGSSVSNTSGTNMVASSFVNPTTSAASSTPDAVTAIAQVNVTNVSGALPSGTLLRGEITDAYLLNSGILKVPAQYDVYIACYERPGSLGIGALQAQFPLRPLLVMGADLLNNATVHVDVFPDDVFSGVVVDTNGGFIAANPVRLIAGPGVFSNQQCIELSSDNATNFSGLPGSNYTVVAAFEAAITGVTAGSQLQPQVTGLAPNSYFVLGQVIDETNIYGVTPLARYHSDTDGNLISDEPTNTDHLAGLTGSGQFVLLQMAVEQDLVEGIATGSSGQPSAGLAVTVPGQPWLTLTSPNGAFKVLAPGGTQNLSLNDNSTGDSGSTTVSVPTNAAPVIASIATGASQLVVASISPADGSTNVPQVTSVVINFSRPINPATLLSNSAELMEGTNSVGSQVTLDLANQTLTILPAATLDQGATFKVVLSSNILDMVGRPLSGQTVFSFTTVPASLRQSTAQLIVYQPGATNLDTNLVSKLPGYVSGTNSTDIVVHGTPGVSDPGVGVIIANENTGETTTVTSQADGSFTSFISGQESDFISATFISLNGARLYVPVNRQLFDDGSVGLYSQGGTLTASGDGGPVQVTVPQNAIPNRTVFKLTSITTNELLTELDGVGPTNAVVAGSALNISMTGDQPTLPVQASFPVDLTAIGYPTNEAPTNVAAMLAIVQSNQNVTTFQVVDQLTFTPAAATPAMKLRKGVYHDGNNQQIANGFLNTSVGTAIGALGVPGFIAQVAFNQVLAPLLFGPRPVVIKGKVAAIPYELSVELENDGLINQVINLQTGIQNIDVPVAVAQQLGLISLVTLPIALAQQAYSVKYQAFQLAAVQSAQPLQGAFVTLVQANNNPLVQEPGRLFPGMVYATSDATGYFLTVAPAAGAQYLITATHPLYSDIQQQPVSPLSGIPGQMGDLGLSGVVFKNFLFEVAAQSQTPPNVSIANTPVLPAAGQTCQLVVNASEPDGAPRVQAVVVAAGPTNLLTGAVETSVTPVLTSQPPTVNGDTTQWTATLTVDKPVTVKIKIVIQSPTSGPGSTLYYNVSFAGPAPVQTVANIPPPPSYDDHGPLVVIANPPNNGYVDDSDTVTIVFNKPIDSQFLTNNLTGIILSISGGNSLAGTIVPIIHVSGDQQSATFQFPGLSPGTTYQLTLTGQSVQDLGGHPLDQIPSTKAADSYTMLFRTPPSVTTPLVDVLNGRGSVISGSQMYVIDEAPQGNYLYAYDISNPSVPVLESQTHLFGQPRDLTVVPQYRYKRFAADSIQQNDLVVVVGGDLDDIISQEGTGQNSQDTTVTVPGQYLWVINMGDPQVPVILASPIVSYRVGSAVTKVRWAPPYLAYEELGSDIQLIGLVNLQELIFGYGSPLGAQLSFGNGRPGVDLLGDGEYVAPGDTLPIPSSHSPTFYGNDLNYVLEGTTQNILDFSVTHAAKTVGVALSGGVLLDANGNPNGAVVPPMYRTLGFNGSPLNLSSPTDAIFPLKGAYPRWVTCFNVLPLIENGSPTTIAAALVSLEPDADGTQELALLDISLPEQPKLVNKIAIPSTVLGGGIQAVSQRPDGLLEVQGQQNLVVMNPVYLALPTPKGQLSPAIISVTPNAGTTVRSWGSTSYGVNSVANGGVSEIIESPPTLQFVNFPGNLGLIDASQLYLQNDAMLGQTLTNLNPVSSLSPAGVNNVTSGGTLIKTSDLNPPNTALHYYVLVNAPGGSGSEIDIGLESLSPIGRPLHNLGYGFAPVRAESTNTQQALNQTPLPCGAPIRALPAYRLSSDPLSPFYNQYMSRPFALITETVYPSQLTMLQGSATVQREILFSGAEMRAFLEPDLSANVALKSFASPIDTQGQVVYPYEYAIAPTVNRDYLPGDNPPAPGGTSPFENTYGTIQSHSGELRTSDIDISLPSPRLPINFIRTIGNQDDYDGPFGPGWDFNYNQRLTVLDPLTFPAGLQMPLVTRDTEGDSDIAGSQDILFNNGAGQIYHFVWQGTNIPSAFSSDPLVIQFDYQDLASDYYLPQHGIFDLMIKYKDGRFERLTPDGKRYLYTTDGRLEYIIDRYPQNNHYLSYDRNDWLIRIDDLSVSAPAGRYIRLGHYRLTPSKDPDYDSTIDTTTSNPYLVGKISQLVDYAGRSIVYTYDANGFLIERDSLQVNGENGGYSGRNHTQYTWKNCKLVGVSDTVNGVPIIMASDTTSASGKPVTTQTTGSAGANTIDVPANNTAAGLATQTSTVTTPDGTKITHTFDQWGNVALTTITETDGVTSTESRLTTPDGLVTFVQRPEGNTETSVYDTNDPIFRAHGNLMSITVNPGPRGGPKYTETFNYDNLYNIQKGDQLTANGFTDNYQLTSDSRDLASVDYNGAGTKTMAYNDNGQMTQMTDEYGVVAATSYDSSTGFVTSHGAGSIQYTYSYDASVASKLGKPGIHFPPVGAATMLYYNNNLQTVEMDRGALTSTSAYDELGRIVFHNEQVGGGKQWQRTWGYDGKNFVTNVVLSGVEVNGAETSLTTTYTPDVQQRLKMITEPNGTVETFQYDGRGNVVQSTIGDYTNSYTYDLNNNVLTQTGNGSLLQSVQYNGLDRSTNVIYNTGNSSYTDTKSYYKGGEIASEVWADSQYGTAKNMTYDLIDALSRHLSTTIHGSTFTPQYSTTYQPLSSTVKGPLMTFTSTWDAAGNQLTYNDPNLTMNFQRDGNGRVMEADNQEVGAIRSQMYTYDDLDHQTSLADLMGNLFTYTPRADGKVVKTVDALNNAVSQDYTSIGELLTRVRADGMETDYRHDQERELVYQGDPGAGFNFTYDGDLRLTSNTLRNGNAFTYAGFDANNMPTTMTIPGGTATLQYDLQKRLLQRKISYQTTTWEEDFLYDAIGRVHSKTYIANGGAQNTATFDYDAAGPMLAAHFNEDGSTYNVNYSYYSDGTVSKLTYQSGPVLNEYRDLTGRLTGLADGNGNIINALAWQGNSEPSQVDLGANIQINNIYDKRGRILTSRATRLSDGAVLTDMRYQYDKVNNPQIRQWLHRGGLADVYGYDVAERLSQAQVGVRLTSASGSGQSLYGRQYNYHQSGLDYLVSMSFSGGATNPPPFGTNWASHDGFLQTTTLDGFPRGPADPLGNVSHALLWVRPSGVSVPQPVAATFQHDGLGRLISVTLTNGVTISNEFQQGDLRFGRTVIQNGKTISSTGYVYDNQSRLLEEYDRTSTQPTIRARYYYASGDAPTAADLLNPSTGKLNRYYYLKDDSQSVIALADTNGTVVERYWYDPYGQPHIEEPDFKAPQINSIQAGANGSLLVMLSEPVESPWTDPGLGTTIVVTTNATANSLNIEDATTAATLAGTVTLLSSQPGYAPFSVLQFTPQSPTTNPIIVNLVPGTLADEWGNSNVAWSTTVTNTNSAGTVLYQSVPVIDTSAPQLARSSLENPFLFQGQYFDYDAGMIYLRARFYDPYAGSLNEPDPMGYAESVNHYAAFGNNPVKLRDPSGLATGFTEEHAAVLETAGYHPAIIESVRNFAPTAAKIGIGANELVSMLQGGMFKAMRENTPFESVFRTFRNPEQRMLNAEAGFRGKPVTEYGKSDAITMLTKGTGRWGERPNNSDIDFVMLLKNGAPTEIGEWLTYKESVNASHLELMPHWQAARERAGQENVQGEQQLIMEHGATLYLPFERATSALNGVENVTVKYKEINKKMANGIGECASIGFDPQRGLYINENVDVPTLTDRSMAVAHDVLMNQGSSRYNPDLAHAFQSAAEYEHDASGLLLPKSLITAQQAGVK